LSARLGGGNGAPDAHLEANQEGYRVVMNKYSVNGYIQTM
jgi:hypothetical protein